MELWRRAPRGKLGHGYDPIFIPQGETRTFAEMSDQEKNAISHRSIATKELVENSSPHQPGRDIKSAPPSEDNRHDRQHPRLRWQ